MGMFFFYIPTGVFDFLYSPLVFVVEMRKFITIYINLLPFLDKY